MASEHGSCGDGRLARPAERIALGVALGAVAGVLAGHVAIWLGIGIAIGMALGASFRRTERECPECAVIHQKHEVRS
jgi:hypothetical protein